MICGQTQCLDQKADFLVRGTSAEPADKSGLLVSKRGAGPDAMPQSLHANDLMNSLSRHRWRSSRNP